MFQTLGAAAEKARFPTKVLHLVDKGLSNSYNPGQNTLGQ